MVLKRMDHVSIVVPDLDAAIGYFEEIGLTAGARTVVEGPWVDRINGLSGVRAEIAMLQSPDGGQVELCAYLHTTATTREPSAPPTTLGYRTVMFEVDDLEDTVARLAPHGGELVGEIVDFDQAYRLCYLRGPAGTIVALAQDLRPPG